MMSQTRIHKHDNHRVDEALPSSLDPRKATDQGLFGLWQVQYPCWLDGSHEPVRYAQATRFLPRSRIFQTREMDGGIQGEPSQVLLLSIWRRPPFVHWRAFCLDGNDPGLGNHCAEMAVKTCSEPQGCAPPTNYASPKVWNGNDTRKERKNGLSGRRFLPLISSSKKNPRVLVLAVLLFFLLVFSNESFFSESGFAQTATSTPIDHIVIIMMENHSFDNIFGVYPDDNSSSKESSQLISSIQKPENLLGRENPSGLVPIPNGTFSTADPAEGYSVYHNDFDGGAMDEFALNSGKQSMMYFTSSQLAIEWDWAEEFAIADHYFSSYLSETTPNRLMSLAAETPVESNYGPPPYVPVNESIFGELSHFGVSWGYYVKGPSTSDYPLEYFSGLDQFAENIRDWSDFASELNGSGSFPSVSWVMPVGGSAHGVDQHPPENVTAGEIWLLNVVNEIMESKYWQSTAIFIMYDEGGGYYDHVPPPQLDGIQLGFRVPMILISPFAMEDYVSETILNHGSILAFIDYNWRIPALNDFVAKSNLPLDLFYFNGSQSLGRGSQRSPIILNSSSSFPANPQIPFDKLLYERTGSSSVTLESLSYPVYVSPTSSWSLSSSAPFPSSLSSAFGLHSYLYTAIILVALLLLLLVILGISRRASRRGRKGIRSNRY